MTKDKLPRRLAIMACESLKEIAGDFRDELERAPTIGELCEILTYGIQSSREELLDGVRVRDVVSLKPKFAQDSAQAGHKRKTRTSAVDGLNDNLFVLANGLWADLANAYKGESGTRPDVKTLCDVIVESLHLCKDNLLSDIRPKDLLAIEAKLQKPPKAAARIGDIVAIPEGDDRYFITVVVARNDFGTAFGVLKGTWPAAPVPASPYPPVIRYPIYSGEKLVEKGLWPIVGHDEALLALFPPQPEVFHRETAGGGSDAVGAFGAAESPSGQWRNLTREEAEEVGLLDDTYSQFYLPEHLGEYLNERNRGQH